MKNENKANFVNIILHISGFLLCVIPATVCTLTYFPIWREAGALSCVAGGGVLICVIFAAPLFNLLRRALSGGGAYMMWLVAFVIFFALSRIANEMTVISFVGFVSNVAGSILMNVGCKKNEQE